MIDAGRTRLRAGLPLDLLTREAEVEIIPPGPSPLDAQQATATLTASLNRGGRSAAVRTLRALHLPSPLGRRYSSAMLHRSFLALLMTVLFAASAPLDSFTESRADYGSPTEQQHPGSHTKNAPCIGVCGCHAGCVIQAGVTKADGPTPVEVPMPRPELTPLSISLEVTAPPPRR